MHNVIHYLLVLVLITKRKNVGATSIKMDFLPLADVRTDPIINPTCLADHVHTFYGALTFFFTFLGMYIG